MKAKKIKLEKAKLNTKRKKLIKKHRVEISEILSGKDNRLLLIIGPCSAWPKKATIEYAKRLADLSCALQDKIKFVMRVYIQKPRTALGWKGMLFEPDPCKKFNLKKGIKEAQEMMQKITDLDLAIADEALFIAPSLYLEDYYAYAAIGARSSEDQEHRAFAATRPYPVGMKNPSSGDLEIASNSVLAARSNAYFYAEGTIFQSDGNKDAHLILRGGKKPNYKEKDILQAIEKLKEKNIEPSLIIDTNHSNSKKNYLKQIDIVKYVLKVVKKNKVVQQAFKGFMIESFLKDGNQPVNCQSKMDMGGLSITDPSLGWEKTEKLIKYIYSHL